MSYKDFCSQQLAKSLGLLSRGNSVKGHTQRGDKQYDKRKIRSKNQHIVIR